jgi:BirA family biotin operon repressor/biotin-[acetyl-CoA-carboxylase] ligase
VSRLDTARLRRLLQAERGLGPVHVLEVTGSTNDDARSLAAEGAPDATVVVAGSQTEGRGRHGRRWHSPAGHGLYLSVLFRPTEGPRDATRYTLASAVAACEAARALGAHGVGIKWPNDLVWRGLKVAGTLAELRSSGGAVSELVIGTGFNVNQQASDFPTELAGAAASLRMAAGSPVERERLAAVFVGRLLRRVHGLGDRFEEILAAWLRMAPDAVGRRVRVVPGAGSAPYDAVTAGVDGRGALRVRGSDGAVRTLTLAESVTALER